MQINDFITFYNRVICRNPQRGNIHFTLELSNSAVDGVYMSHRRWTATADAKLVKVLDACGVGGAALGCLEDNDRHTVLYIVGCTYGIYFMGKECI